jgi:cytochrome c oxidase subunit I+III
MLVAGSLYFAYVFSYLFTWTVSPQQWSEGAPLRPALIWPWASTALLILAGFSTLGAARALGRSAGGFIALVLLAMTALVVGLIVEFVGHWQYGLRPEASAYGALVYLASALQLEIVAAIVVIGAYTIARLLARRLNAERRVTFDVFLLLTYYAIGQGLIGLLMVHGFPSVVL